MNTSISQTTANVLAKLTANTEPTWVTTTNLGTINSLYTSPSGSLPGEGCFTLTSANNSSDVININNTVQMQDITSGYTWVTGVTTTSGSTTITTTQTLPDTGFVYVGDPLPNTGTFTIPGTNTIPGTLIYPPINVDPPPFTFAPQPNPLIWPIPIDYEKLEEGVHEIKGGKVIIKKIKVDDLELDRVLAEELKHEPTEEEKRQLREELHHLSEIEDREI